MLDKSKLPGDAWVRALWIPADGSPADERPIVLVSDRRRFLIAGPPMIAAFLVGIALALIHAPAAAAIVCLLIVFVIWLYARGGFSGYYEVRKDGSLGYLGVRMPIGIGSMRRTKP